MSKEPLNESDRLQALWQGDFGDAYTERNREAGEGRLPFWQDVLTGLSVSRVLEVGCNRGGNLRWLHTLLPASGVFGVDVNASALGRLRQAHPVVNAVWARALELPFRDEFFDLVFTTGVLIHQPPADLPGVMDEIVRCSRRYVLAGEYFAETLTEVPYRGETGALFKADFGGLYQARFPTLRLIRNGFLPRDASGFDDVTWWLFEKTA